MPEAYSGILIAQAKAKIPQINTIFNRLNSERKSQTRRVKVKEKKDSIHFEELKIGNVNVCASGGVDTSELAAFYGLLQKGLPGHINNDPEQTRSFLDKLYTIEIGGDSASSFRRLVQTCNFSSDLGITFANISSEPLELMRQLFDGVKLEDINVPISCDGVISSDFREKNEPELIKIAV